MPDAVTTPRLSLIALLAATLTLSGCDFLGGVVEFGFWTGVLFVAVLVLLVGFAVRAFRR